MRFHHVQVAIPPGGEAEAHSFYGELLGMDEVSKPAALADRGGCWFRSGRAEIHCGVEEDFRPARRAHPAIEVETFDRLCTRLTDADLEIRPDGLLPGRRRFYVDDPFRNRIEVIEARRQ